MAKSKDNVVMEGASGKIGRMLVFRQRAGSTIIARRPAKSNKPATEEQLVVQNRFTEAAFYAKAAIADPDRKAAYQAKAKPGQSAYNVAFADYLKMPELKEIVLEDYQGNPGDTITFKIQDIFELKSVSVTITEADGTFIEEGPALQQANKMYWQYTATMANPDYAGSKLILKIKDTPGKLIIAEEVI